MMGTLIRVEFAKLRSVRTFWISVGAALAVTGLTLAMQLRNAGVAGTPSLGTAQSAVTILGAGGRSALVALVVGIVLVTAEFRHDTITTTLLLTPDRARVVRAKLAAAAVFGLLLAVLTTAVSAGLGLATGAVTTALSNTAVVSTVAGLAVGIPLYAMLGVGIGTLVPNQTVAVAGTLVWFLVVETLLGSFGLDWLQPYTPTGAAAAIASDRSLAGALPPWGGVALLAAYGLGLAAVGAWHLRRRDIA